VAQPSDSAVLPSRLQSQDPQGLGDDHALFGVIWGRDTLKNFEALKSSLTAGGLVRDHTADSLVEDARWGTEMEGTASFIITGSFAKVGMVLD